MMIRADDSPLVAAPARHDGAAMAAHIGESADFSILAADDNHRFVANLDRHEIAGLGHFLPATNADPLAHEQLLAFQGENARICIKPSRHRAGPIIGQAADLLEGTIYQSKTIVGHVWPCLRYPRDPVPPQRKTPRSTKTCAMAVVSIPVRFFAVAVRKL